ncbi:MAG: ankyrin repeat domain-containing protein, partial [Phycisphaerales bacterium]
ADVKAQDEAGRTPLYNLGLPFRAVSTDDRAIAELLLAQGAEISPERTYYNEQLLLFAARQGLPDLVERLLATGTDPDACDLHVDDSTALLKAIVHGHEETVKVLLAGGADVDGKNGAGITPLLVAVCMDDRAVAELLVDAGANVSLEGSSDDDRRYYGSIGRGHSWAEYLLRGLGGQTPLHAAAHVGSEELTEFLLMQGAEVGSVDEDGDTPLHVATHAGHLDVARVLLDHGADVDSKNRSGITPLRGAVFGRNAELVTLLLHRGADINATDGDGDTVLHAAALRGYTEVVELLMAYGADASLRDIGGNMPLDEAVRRGQREVIELLRKRQSER